MIKDVDKYAKSLYKNGLTCREIVESSDRIQTIYNIYQTIDYIWSQSNCFNCFQNYSLINGTVNYTLNKNVEEYFKREENLDECIFNFTQKPFNIDPLFQNYSANSSLCHVCKEYYMNVSSFYDNLGNEDKICMDVVDSVDIFFYYS
jgi:hypothetical protein